MVFHPHCTIDPEGLSFSGDLITGTPIVRLKKHSWRSLAKKVHEVVCAHPLYLLSPITLCHLTPPLYPLISFPPDTLIPCIPLSL